jgi:uncharacterized RDD family membrane protein YckC
MYCPQCGSATQPDARFCRACGAALEPAAAAPVVAEQAAPRPGYLPSNVGVLEAAVAARAREYAGFWRRAAAALIDVLLMLAITFVLSVVVVLALPAATTSSWAFLTGLIRFVVFVLYFPLQESSDAQATLGKRALGIKVTNLNGQRISFVRAVARTFAKMLSVVILLIGFLMAAFTERKQALHDMVAGTYVLRV